MSSTQNAGEKGTFRFFNLPEAFEDPAGKTEYPPFRPSAGYQVTPPEGGGHTASNCLRNATCPA